MVENKQERLKQNLQNTNQWIRILYMVLFAIISYFVMMAIGVVVLIQVLFALFSGSDNANLRKLGADLTKYINQILSFLTYNENRKPFPFAACGELEEVKAETVQTDEVDEHESEAVSVIEPKEDPDPKKTRTKKPDPKK